MCTVTTYSDARGLVGDVAPRQRQSRHCLWRDLVTSSILT
jgi:hypothetical protein